MALVSGSLGTLLQGVSQQPARVRLAGQVTEQVNMISDVTLGLSTRPSTTSGAVLVGGTPDHKYTDLRFAGEDYTIGFKDNDLRIWLLDGTVKPITLRNGGSLSYCGTDMRFHVIEEKIVVLNRNTDVLMDSYIEGRAWNVSLLHALGGQFLKTYEVKIVFSNAVEITVSYTAPDGTTSGDAAKTTSEYIIQELVTAILADPLLPAGTTVIREFDVARVYHPTLTMNISVSDGEGGEVLRALSDTVKKVDDLPRFAPNGTIVKVITSEADEDDYWLRFDAKGVVTEDGTAGFGQEGLWTEWYNPEEERNFDLTTMPHVLVLEAGTFYLEQGPFEPRLVGDADSAPIPSFVGKPIKDVAGFESRLAFLAPASWITSRTNAGFDFWRESATVISATDPIDITSTKKDDLRLDWMVVFDRDLYLMADPGDSQFVIRGGGIDPDTASMVLTTEFEIASAGTPPVSTGRAILFPFNAGRFSGIKEFYTDSDLAVNAANSLTETQDRYIVGGVNEMAVSQNFNIALMTTDDPAYTNTIWIYKYLWDGRDPLQSAWGKWEFKDNVEYFFFRGSKVYVLGSDLDGDVFTHVLDLNRPLGEFGYHEMLDRGVVVTAVTASFGTRTEVTLPYGSARFLQSSGCANPGLEIKPVQEVRVDSLNTKYWFDPDAVPIGATLRCGQSIDWLVTPSEVFAKDFQDRIDTSKKVTIQDYVVHVDNSGEFYAEGTSPYAPTWTYDAYVFPLDNEPLDPDRLLLQTGAFYIPWGERADYSEVTFKGNDIRPVTIHEVAWIGQVLKTKGRRT